MAEVGRLLANAKIDFNSFVGRVLLICNKKQCFARITKIPTKNIGRKKIFFFIVRLTVRREVEGSATSALTASKCEVFYPYRSNAHQKSHEKLTLNVGGGEELTVTVSLK